MNISFGYNGNGPGSYFNASLFLEGLAIGWYNYAIGKERWAGMSYPIHSFQNFEYKIEHVGHEEFDINLLSASECALVACVKTYNVSIAHGMPHETVISEWYNDTLAGKYAAGFPGGELPPLYLKPPDITNGSNFEGPFCLSGPDQKDIGLSLAGKLKGMITVSNVSGVAVGDPRWLYTSTGNITHVVENIALSLTAALQGTANGEPVFGENSTLEQYVHIRWAWLALPILLALLSLLFLLLTIYTTKQNRVSIWKSSTLVLLYHGLEVTPLEENYPLDQLSQMHRLAAETRLRLRRDEDDCVEIDGFSANAISRRVDRTD